MYIFLHILYILNVYIIYIEYIYIMSKLEILLGYSIPTISIGVKCTLL